MCLQDFAGSELVVPLGERILGERIHRWELERWLTVMMVWP